MLDLINLDRQLSFTLYFIIVFDFSGNFTDRATPVPIPNTEVKPIEVDGTMVTRPWESRTLPVYIKSPVVEKLQGFFIYA